MAAVKLEGITKRFGETVVLEPLDLEIHDGELLVLLGPSGCGKSTTLRIIAGLETPSEGVLRIGDRDVTDLAPKERDIAMVFQSYALYPHLTVRENLGFGLKVRKTPKAEAEARIAEAAAMLELEPLLDRKPKALSGGQRQRVAMGRAIVRRPSVFLFDEPLSNLDAALRTQMRAEIAKLHRRLGTTIIYVTHDQIEAMTLASRIVILNQGRVQQVGPPLEVYARPSNGFVGAFLGAPPMNFIAGRVGDGPTFSGAGFTLALEPACKGHAGQDVFLGVRPEALRIDADGPIGATVELVEPTGGDAFVRCAVADQLLVARVGGASTLTMGDTPRFSVAPDELLLFARGEDGAPAEVLA